MESQRRTAYVNIRRLKQEIALEKNEIRILRQFKRRKETVSAGRGRPKLDYDELEDRSRSMRISREGDKLKKEYGDNFEVFMRGLAKRYLNLTAFESALLMIEIGLSWRKQVILRSRLRSYGKNFLKSIKIVRRTLQEASVDFSLKRTTVTCAELDKKYKRKIGEIDIEVIEVDSLLDVIRSRINQMIKSNTFVELDKYPDTILICFLADKGRSHTKMSFILGNKESAVNSINNLTVIAAYENDEKPHIVRKAFASICRKIDELPRTLTFLDKEFGLKKFFAGDLKMQSIIYGLALGRPRFYCTRCMSIETGTYSEYDVDEVNEARNDFLDGANDCNKVNFPMIKTIPPCNYIIPWLHIMITLTPDVLKLARREIMRFDIAGISEEELEKRIEELHGNKVIKELQEEIKELDVEMERALTDYDIVQGAIKSILGNEKTDDTQPEAREICLSEWGCFEDVGIFLPARLNTAAFVYCDYCPKERYVHTYCEDVQLPLRPSQKYKCRACKDETTDRLTIRKEKLVKQLNEDAQLRLEKMKIIEKSRREKFNLIKETIIASEPSMPDSQTNNFENMLAKIAATRAKYWQEMNGNQCNRVLKNAPLLYNSLHPTLKNNEGIKSVFDALKIMYSIQSKFLEFSLQYTYEL